MLNEELAELLLGGFVETDKYNRLRHRHLKEGSAEEREARRAIAKVLRSPVLLGRQLRDSLADLFDPETPGWEQRRIKLVYRRRGKLIDHNRATEVLTEVVMNIRANCSRNKAIGNTAAKFSMSEEMVKRIWRRYWRSLGDKLLKEEYGVI
jgi:hypothetical protein